MGDRGTVTVTRIFKPNDTYGGYLSKDLPKKSGWAKTNSRPDLKRCPFCGTIALHQVRLANSDTDMQHRIVCGNPFCFVDVATQVTADEGYAVELWQERT